MWLRIIDGLHQVFIDSLEVQSAGQTWCFWTDELSNAPRETTKGAISFITFLCV